MPARVAKTESKTEAADAKADRSPLSDVKAHRVVVFSKSYCGYCARTKALLQSLHAQDVVVHELDVEEGGSTTQRKLAAITGRRTVPQTFIGGQLVGGNDDLQSLHRRGGLVTALKDAGAL